MTPLGSQAGDGTGSDGRAVGEGSAGDGTGGASDVGDSVGDAPVTAGGYPYRKKVLVVGAAALAAVMVVTATLVALFWPDYRPLDFHAIDDELRVAPAVPMSTGFAQVAVLSERAYFANVSPSGTLGVVAAATDTGRTLWSSTAAGSAPRWGRVVAVPDAVVALAAPGPGRRMVLLDPRTGALLWQRALRDADRVVFAGHLVVVADTAARQLVGLDIRRRGRQVWTQPLGTAPKLLEVSTVADVTGPADVTGAAFTPDPDDDPRLVHVSGGSVRVLHAETGQVLVPARPGVADAAAELVAHHGRLYVRRGGPDPQVLSYDLETLAEPRVLYRPAGPARQLARLTPCGADRVCLLETAGHDRATAEVVAVDAAAGTVLWRRAAPQAERLVSVGENVLVPRTASRRHATLIARDGTVTWTGEDEVARLDGGNVLRFSKRSTPDPHDSALTGQPLGADPVQLGPVSDVRLATCGWNTAVLGCAAERDFVLRRFAG